jgi:hypothetical protein
MQDTFFSVTSGSAKITLNGADVFVEAEGNITLAAGGDITIAAGGTINVVSGGPTSVQASAEALNLKGPLVKINC